MTKTKKLLSGRAGNHTWNLVQPIGGRTVSIDSITGNITSAWTMETRAFDPRGTQWGSNAKGVLSVGRMPWKKNGSPNRAYYNALKRVARRTEKRDIVLVVRLFEGSVAQNKDFKGAWKNHWTRTINGKRPKAAEFVHTKGKWNKYQKQHVQLVAKTLKNYDNITGMVGNELHRNSIKWFQPKVIKWWREYSDAPIGVGYAQGIKPSRGKNQSWMRRTGADWVSPANGERIKGFRGLQIFDTDHTSPLRSNLDALQTSWGRGDALLLMDGFSGSILRNQGSLARDRSFIDSIV